MSDDQFILELNSVTIMTLQRELTIQWHRDEVDIAGEGLLGLIRDQHECNYRVWHEEETCRTNPEDDGVVAAAKRIVDRFNRNRNDLIEKIDILIAKKIESLRGPFHLELPMNSETPGSIIDRLSIIDLRLYHLRELLEANDRQRSDELSVKKEICEEQLDDLGNSFDQLANDLLEGKKQLKLFRHLKIYDPKLIVDHASSSCE